MPEYTIDGCTLQYDTLGDGIPLALTPGGRAAKEALRPLAEKLAGTCQVLLWDRRNTGASDVFFGGAGSEQQVWADDLARLLAHLGMAPAYVGGGSAGARVSLLAAIRHPESVKGLVLWSASGGPYGSQVLGYQYHVPFIVAAQGGGMEAVAATPFFAERIQANPANRRRLLEQDPQAFVETMKRWNAFFYYRDDTPVIGATRKELAAISAPTLIFEGNDDIHPKEASDAVHEAVPESGLTPSVWTRDEWMDRYTGKVREPLMETLYPRLAGRILDFLRASEGRG